MLPITGTATNLPKSELRRRSILEATLRVVAAGGVESATHRRVAEEAGVSLGSTTYHFDSKSDLLREAFRYYISYIYGLQAEVTRDWTELDIDEAVNAVVEFTNREFEDKSLLRAEYELLAMASRDEELAREAQQFEERTTALIARMLEQLGSQRPFEGARTILQLCRGFEIHSLSREDPDVDDFRRRLRVVMQALVYEQSAAPAAARVRV